jgi:hypothetical protein
MQKLVSEAISQGRDTVDPATLATQIHGVTGQVIWLSCLFLIGPKARALVARLAGRRWPREPRSEEAA